MISTKSNLRIRKLLYGLPWIGVWTRPGLLQVCKWERRSLQVRWAVWGHMGSSDFGGVFWEEHRRKARGWRLVHVVGLSLEVGEVLPVELGDGAPSTQSLDHIVKLQEGSRSGPTTWSTLFIRHPWLPGNPESKSPLSSFKDGKTCCSRWDLSSDHLDPSPGLFSLPRSSHRDCEWGNWERKEWECEEGWVTEPGAHSYRLAEPSLSKENHWGSRSPRSCLASQMLGLSFLCPRLYSLLDPGLALRRHSLNRWYWGTTRAP